jgi:hypothetical protein
VVNPMIEMVDELIQLVEMVCLTYQGGGQLLELKCATLGRGREDVGERSSDDVEFDLLNR